jgi:hypothetical protein
MFFDFIVVCLVFCLLAICQGNFLVRYFDSLIFLLKDAAVHWKRFGSYFYLLEMSCKLGTNQCTYLLKKHNLLARCIDFFIGEESPVPAAEM